MSVPGELSKAIAEDGFAIGENGRQAAPGLQHNAHPGGIIVGTGCIRGQIGMHTQSQDTCLKERDEQAEPAHPGRTQQGTQSEKCASSCR